MRDQSRSAALRANISPGGEMFGLTETNFEILTAEVFKQEPIPPVGRDQRGADGHGRSAHDRVARAE